MGCFVDLLLRCFGGCFGIQHHERSRSRPRTSMNIKAKALEPQKKKDIARRLGRPEIKSTKTSLYEDVVLDCEIVMNPDKTEVECATKQALVDQVSVPLLMPELYSQGSKLFSDPLRGVLLHGPPQSNTGKATLLAAAKFIAKESGAVFIDARKIANVIIGDRFSECDAEQKRQILAAVFSLAYKLRPAVIYINDMDSFLGQLSQANMKAEFIDIWEGFVADHKNEHTQVAVLYANSKCNRVSPELDEAIQLRWEAKIRKPRRKERTELLKLLLKEERVEHNIDYDDLATMTIGYESSDLYQLCKKAAFLPIKEHLQYINSGKKPSSPPRPMSQLDLENVVIEELDRDLNKLLQQVKSISALPDQTHNENHQLKRIMRSLGLDCRGKDESDVMGKTNRGL